MSENPSLRWLISVDDHLFEPPDVWTSRAPAGLRDRVPHTIEEGGVTYWSYEDVRVPISGVLLYAGSDPKTFDPGPVKFEDIRPEYYDSVARLKDMDRDGVLSSLCFPYFPRSCGQTFYEAKDRDVAMECVLAYNDWVIDEWAGNAPGRYLPLIIVPLWDPHRAAQEIERCAGKGAAAVSFSENPAKLGLPSIHHPDNYWDPVFRAASDAGLPLAIHFGSSSSVPITSDDAPSLVTGALSPISLASALTDWMFSGQLPRFPELKVLMSEGGIGWIPYMVERCDRMVKTQEWAQRGDFRFDLARGIGEALERAVTYDQLPSELFRKHFFGCFIDDAFGCRHLEEIGFDNVMMETDYPHPDSSYPGSIANAHSLLDGYSDEVKYKVMQGNARALFNFTPAEPPVE